MLALLFCGSCGAGFFMTDLGKYTCCLPALKGLEVRAERPDWIGLLDNVGLGFWA